MAKAAEMGYKLAPLRGQGQCATLEATSFVGTPMSLSPVKQHSNVKHKFFEESSVQQKDLDLNRGQVHKLVVHNLDNNAGSSRRTVLENRASMSSIASSVVQTDFQQVAPESKKEAAPAQIFTLQG